jgi:hypothetical protein
MITAWPFVRQASTSAADQLARELGQVPDAMPGDQIAKLALDAIVSLTVSFRQIVPRHWPTMPH